MNLSQNISCQITVIIVSSYSPTNPSTALIEDVIKSLENIDGLCNYTTIIILDGYEIRDVPETKKGRITRNMACNYEVYCKNIIEKFSGPKFKIKKCECHRGFAFCVREGLEATTTPYALIVQHDRVFINRIEYLGDLLSTIERYNFIRYIGFPTITSRTHVAQILHRYSLPRFVQEDLRIHIYSCFNNNHDSHERCRPFLQPLLFWFDSNHLCHVDRYLQIYRPFKNILPELKTLLGPKRVKELVLRQGDFIEDRFGQMQRKILTNILIEEYDNYNTNLTSSSALALSASSSDSNLDLLASSFVWFGSYLYWHPESNYDTTYNSNVDENNLLSRIYVKHLDGRRRNPFKYQSRTHYNLKKSYMIDEVEWDGDENKKSVDEPPSLVNLFSSEM